MYLNFVPKFGRDCLNINYIYANRKKVKEIADSRSDTSQETQKTLSKIIHKLDNLYHKNKNIDIYSQKTVQIFDALALSLIGKDDFKLIASIEEKYPELREYVFKEFRAYKTVFPVLEKKVKKYRKRAKRFLILSVILMFTTILLSIFLWSKI